MPSSESTSSIFELITWVDKHYLEISKKYDGLSGWKDSIILIFAASFGSILLTGFSSATVTERFSITIAISALLISLLAMILPIADSNRIRARYRRAIKLKEKGNPFTPCEKPLLKALIKLKCKNEETSLETLYRMNSGLFIEQTLLEQVYFD